MNTLHSYFNGDTIAADSWSEKYQMKDETGKPVEDTPREMHRREAREFARIEVAYREKENRVTDELFNQLSEYGQKLLQKRVHQTEEEIADELFSYFDKFKYIVPQGSIMANLGNPYVFGSLSNCFGIAPPEDSYGGIMRADQELVQLMKRRGGVGTTLNNLRPVNTAVTNASRSSSGVVSFASRFSNTTREVAQEGRRGALMLLLSVKHPEIFRFVKMKADKSKVTGANVTVMFTNEFMVAVGNDRDFICRFPIDLDISSFEDLTDSITQYNNIIKIKKGSISGYAMKIKAKELFDEFISMSWDNGEPGAAYIDTIVDYSPDGVYEAYIPRLSNPCGEQWFHEYDTCRLIAENLLSIIKKAFSDESEVDYEKLYSMSYMQQRLGDDLVDLEIEHIDKILDKLIRKDTEPDEVKRPEIVLWQKIRKIAQEGRRTGSGFTALADMIAAMGFKYDSKEAYQLVDSVLYTKMQAELDATIDMAILRGTFHGWDSDKEFGFDNTKNFEGKNGMFGKNSFYDMIGIEFPEQALLMQMFGRRNVSWSTVAPTGTVSIMTQTTSGLEPLFKAYYIRRRKINSENAKIRVDFTDQNGDQWQEYPVLHPKFKKWVKQYAYSSVLNNGQQAILREIDEPYSDDIVDNLTKEEIQELFEKSPWYGSEANDISWEGRIRMNSIIQKYTSNSLSCTINLPNDVTKETIHNLFFEAWKNGLKGLTVYRDGSRSGVLVTESSITKKDEFGYNDAIKRPESLDAHYYYISSNSKEYAVIVGLLNDNPYELFAYESPLSKYDILDGKVIKYGKGSYSFKSSYTNIENLHVHANHSDEKLLTRWVSLLLRHGANPRFIVEQVDKSEVGVISFAKAISRVLKKYIPDTQTSEVCTNCGEATIIYQEGCKRCSSCGNSKC